MVVGMHSAPAHDLWPNCDPGRGVKSFPKVPGKMQGKPLRRSWEPVWAVARGAA